MRKGQVFIVSAIIFSALILLTAFSYQQIVFTDSGSNTQFYFSNTLDKQAEIFNHHIEDNYTVENMKKGFYSFNSFVNSQSSGKGIEYSSFQLIILPEKNTTLIINYRDQSTEFNYHVNSWHNQTLEPQQSTTIQGRENPRILEVEDYDISTEFNASTPTLLGYMEMESESETWRNYILR